MNPSDAKPPVLAEPAPSPQQVLRRLFLTLFLRGRTSRGLQKEGAPKTIASKLALTLFFYALFGCMAFFFNRQPVFALSAYLHAMTFVFLGMFVASSAGEILFNPEEGDMLLHRPVTARALLWAKIRVLLEVSIWIAGVFNLAGLLVGLNASNGGALFPLIHAVTTVLEAFFCTGCVVLVYQLCLRWFGRERLENLMTAAQVIVSVAAVFSGQILPRLMLRFHGEINLDAETWWVGFFPPAWFAGLDDAVAGGGKTASWLLGGVGLIATGVVLWLAFGKLAQDYQSGMQALNETVSKRGRKQPGTRWIERLIDLPPLRGWLKDPVARASFLLSAAYLVRDRDVKLRVYPGVAPILIMPFVFLMQRQGAGDFGIAFSGCYAGLIPMMTIGMLHYSQQWKAADVFRAAPIPGPGPLCDGARRAVLLFITAPMVLVLALIVRFLHGTDAGLFLLLPGIIAMPVYALAPSLGGKGVPLSQPAEEAKAAGRGLIMFGMTMAAVALAGLALLARSQGWFWWLIAVEAVVIVLVYAGLRWSVARAKWTSLE